MNRRIGVLCGMVALAGCQGVEGDAPGERVAWAPPVGTFTAEGPAIAAPLDEAMAAVRARPIWNEAEQAWVHRTGGLFARIDESVHLTESGDPDWSVQIQWAGVGRAGGLSSGPVRTVDAWSDTVRIEREGVSEFREGFDEHFKRIWEFYFCYCEGGFDEAVLGSIQFLFAKPEAEVPGLVDLPPLRRHVA